MRGQPPIVGGGEGRWGGCGPPNPYASPAPGANIRTVDSIRGQLLIAGPSLADPNFWRTVVLIVEHTDEGALGLVLNRPSEATIGDAVPELGDLIPPETDVLVGGPVQQSAVIVLAEFEDPSDAAMIAFDDIASKSVLPSGADFRTSSVPILVLAPGLFSTTNGWPSFSDSACAISRPIMSGEPPAGTVTNRRTGRVG